MEIVRSEVALLECRAKPCGPHTVLIPEMPKGSWRPPSFQARFTQMGFPEISGRVSIRTVVHWGPVNHGMEATKSVSESF